MPDETKRIEALYGPYRGFLDVPADVAAQAIKDGWARDPYAPPAAPDAPAPTQEQIDKAIIAAEKAARKLRGEDEPKAKEKAKAKAGEETKSYEAGSTGEGYETREAARKPGRPPKTEE